MVTFNPTKYIVTWVCHCHLVPREKPIRARVLVGVGFLIRTRSPSPAPTQCLRIWTSCELRRREPFAFFRSSLSAVGHFIRSLPQLLMAFSPFLTFVYVVLSAMLGTISRSAYAVSGEPPQRGSQHPLASYSTVVPQP